MLALAVLSGSFGIELVANGSMAWPCFFLQCGLQVGAQLHLASPLPIQAQSGWKEMQSNGSPWLHPVPA